MGLSNVTINVSNGNLGGVQNFSDGLAGIICTAVTVTDKLTLGTVYRVTSLNNAVTVLGIDNEGDNAYLHSVIDDYYNSVGGDTPLYVLPVADSVKMSDMIDKDNSYVAALMVATGGNMRLLAVSQRSTENETISNALDEDVEATVIKGQVAHEYYRDKMQPFRFIVDGKNYNGNVADLKDYNEASYNGGSIFLATKSGDSNSRIGLMLGALSAVDVQRRISRVKNGPVSIGYDPYIGGSIVEAVEGDWDDLHDKGYVFLRNFSGKNGYFFSSDRTATATTDDYASLTRGRVIDKAMLIAYSTYVNELNEELSLDSDGKLSASVVKSQEELIINAINRTMANAISEVQASIDENQNILSNNTMSVSLKIVPLGALGEIVVNIGFDNPNAN